jgi:ubiquinone/menaquinone biosynthesis C-methylase UbiE
MTTIDQPTDTAAAEHLVGRLFGATLGTAELFNTRLGIVHDLYGALARSGPLTAGELADVTGVELRYLLDWLQGQAISGLLILDGDEVATGCYALAAGVFEVLLDETNPYYAGGMAAIPVAIGKAYPLVEESFRTGAGVPYAAYGTEAVCAQEALNRPAFVNSLVPEWLPALPDVQAALTKGARVADLGTGAGWSAIELARAYPQIQVDGYDNDEDSISRARRNAAEHGVSERVTFEVRDIAAVAARGPRYDLVTFFECLHDLAYPIDALAAARQALRPGGTVLVMDERVQESLTVPGDEVERFFAAAGVVWCTPQGRVERDSQVIGPVLRPAKLREIAAAAGFGTVETLPIEHPFWRFYQLQP